MAALVLPGEVLSVALGAGRLYAGTSEGVAILRTLRPETPERVGQIVAKGAVLAMAIEGQYVYVSFRGSGIMCFDARDAAQPEVRWAAEPVGTVEGVAVAGDYLLAAAGPAGLRILHLPNRNWVGAYAGLPTNEEIKYAPDTSRIAIGGDYAFIAEGNCVSSVSIADPERLRIAATILVEGTVTGIAVGGARACVASYEHAVSHGGGLVVYDISDGVLPRMLASTGVPRHASGVALAAELDTTAYVAAGDEGLWIIGTEDLATPTTHRVDVPGWSAAVAVQGNLAYVAAATMGLQIVDLAAGGGPRVVGAVSLPGLAGSIAVAGGYAYVAAGSRGLRVVDVSDPVQPREVGALDTPGDASDVAVVDQLAFVANNRGGLWAIDVSDATVPRAVGRLETTYDVRNLAVNAPYIYLTESKTSLTVVRFDVTAATAPTTGTPAKPPVAPPVPSPSMPEGTPATATSTPPVSPTSTPATGTPPAPSPSTPDGTPSKTAQPARR